MSKEKNKPFMFKNVIFPAPYVIFETAIRSKVLAHFFDERVIPIIEIFDREHHLFKQMDALPKPEGITKIISVAVCMHYKENFKC